MQKNKGKLIRKFMTMFSALAVATTLINPGIQASPTIQSATETSSVFIQFYAQNQSNDWTWMSTPSTNLILNEPIHLNLSTLTDSGKSIFELAQADSSFGLQFGDSALKVGDESTVGLSIDTITIKATNYDDLLINLTPASLTENYLAKETSWGIDGNTTMISLKNYLGEDFESYLKSITSIEATVTLNDYHYTAHSTDNEEPDNQEPSSPLTLFEGTGTSDGSWGQAITLYAGTDFKVSSLSENSQIAVTYQSEREPELILSSWSGGTTWAKVSPYKTSDGIAYFSYKDFLSSYQAGLDEQDATSPFPHLDVIYVGDTGAPLTVTKVTLQATDSTSSTIYPYKDGDETKVCGQFYAQNQSGNWEWMSPGTQNFIFNKKQQLTFDVDSAADIFGVADAGATFGFQVCDAALADGEESQIGVTIDEITLVAPGYEDLVIHLSPNTYSETYVAEKVSWGIQGNATFISLKQYLPEDFLPYLNAITQMKVTLSLTDYKQIIREKEEVEEFPSDYTHPTLMRGLSAPELVSEMGLGWNLGNTLEALGGETAWGNPKTTRKMIDKIADAGFKTLRIPITWDDHMDENFVIDPDFLERVDTVVNYGLANDLYVIINIHHSYGWSMISEETEDEVIAGYTKLWDQIATHFSDYSDFLIFETENEPRDGDDWVGYEKAYEIINHLNAACVNTIRQTGNNNTDRLIMIPGYAASSNTQSITAIKVPENDDHIAISVHAYSPYSFAMDTSANSQTTWKYSDNRSLVNIFSLLDETFIKKGIPVVIGEFASTNKNNLDARVAHARDYISLATKYGIPCSWWDNGAWKANSSDAMGLFNRRTLEWVFPEILSALFEGYNNPADDIEFNPLVLFKGSATSAGTWGQVLKFTPDVDFLLSDLIANSQIAVTYESENAPELILQSWSGGPGWVKVAPSKIKNGVAYYDYEDMMAAYNTAMNKESIPSNPFPNLNMLYVGDTGAPLAVTKVMILQSPISGELHVQGEWPDGINAQLTLSNISDTDLDNWVISFEYPGNITSLWNAKLVSHEGNTYIIRSTDWNLGLRTNESTTIGFIANQASTNLTPIKYHLLSNRQIRNTADYNITFTPLNYCNEQLNGTLTLTNVSTTPLENWEINFKLAGDIIELWNGKLIEGENYNYIIKNSDYNSSILPGQSVTIGLIALTTDETTVPTDFTVSHITY